MDREKAYCNHWRRAKLTSLLERPALATFLDPFAIKIQLQAAAVRLLDVVLPPRSLDEVSGAVQSHGLTAVGWGKIAFIEAPFCEGCGAPFEFDLGVNVLCLACQGRRPAFDRGRAACIYDENSRDLILKFKHADRTDLTGLFTGWIARAAADILRDADGVVPVPLHRTRLLGRRYNQAAEIARRLSSRTGLMYFPDALVRLRPTKSQGGQSASGRRRNVVGAFATSSGWRSRIEGRRLVLIDDVLTTGATLEACARTLKAAGAAQVDVAVIARVKEHSGRPI